jgi:hypothetical protein
MRGSLCIPAAPPARLVRHHRTQHGTRDKRAESEWTVAASEESTELVLSARLRSPVTSSILLTAAIAAALLTLASLLPLAGNVDHAIGHLALAVPLLLLLAAVVFTWPPFGVGPTARWVRTLLLVALGAFGGGLLLEAVGAFGYTEDGVGRANRLAVLHDIGVVVWSSGFILTVVAAILAVAVSIADRRGAGRSRFLTITVALAILVVVAFEVGALVFGY